VLSGSHVSHRGVPPVQDWGGRATSAIAAPCQVARDTGVERAARITFAAALLAAFVMAVLPHPPRVPGEPSDKILHVLAFTVLGVLSGYGFRNRSIAQLFAALTCFGALIELVQAVPMLNRDSDLADLLADMAAALAALAVVRSLMARSDRKIPPRTGA
jgi:VanZ family protein